MSSNGDVVQGFLQGHTRQVDTTHLSRGADPTQTSGPVDPRYFSQTHTSVTKSSTPPPVVVGTVYYDTALKRFRVAKKNGVWESFLG